MALLDCMCTLFKYDWITLVYGKWTLLQPIVFFLVVAYLHVQRVELIEGAIAVHRSLTTNQVVGHDGRWSIGRLVWHGTIVLRKQNAMSQVLEWQMIVKGQQLRGKEPGLAQETTHPFQQGTFIMEWTWKCTRAHLGTVPCQCWPLISAQGHNGVQLIALRPHGHQFAGMRVHVHIGYVMLATWHWARGLHSSGPRWLPPLRPIHPVHSYDPQCCIADLAVNLRWCV